MTKQELLDLAVRKMHENIEIAKKEGDNVVVIYFNALQNRHVAGHFKQLGYKTKYNHIGVCVSWSKKEGGL